MPFFQNPLPDDFDGSLPLGDRQHVPKYVVRGNAGRGREVVFAWGGTGPFNLSGTDADGDDTDILVINFCLYNFKNWGSFNIDLTAEAASASAVTAEEVVASLRADALFAERFVADFGQFNDSTARTIRIRQKKPTTEFQFYVGNGKAESVLKFNGRAGVAELPTYFSRHTIANRFTYPDSEGKVIELNPSGSDVDAALIDGAVDARGVSLGYDSGTVREDWALLRGKSGIFNFQKLTVDGSDRITEIIEYPAGALAGDFARKITYQYTSANKNPDQIAEIPYTLQSSDLITP
jgi:hypothetical protein